MAEICPLPTPQHPPALKSDPFMTLSVCMANTAIITTTFQRADDFIAGIYLPDEVVIMKLFNVITCCYSA